MHLHPWKFHEQEQPDKYTKINKTTLNVAYFTMLWWRNQIRELPGASYRCECGSKANTFYRPPQDRNPLCNERATSNKILETLDFKGNEIFLEIQLTWFPPIIEHFQIPTSRKSSTGSL